MSRIRLFAATIFFLSLVMLAQGHVLAQGPQALPCRPVDPLPPSSQVGPDGHSPVQCSRGGECFMPEGAQQTQEAPGATALATGGPDDFGYTWDDTVPLNWIDATTGTATGLGGSTRVVGPISLPFSFKFYENAYSEVYISKYGYLGFTNFDLDRSQGYVLKPATPNNIIAPYWVPSLVNESGYTGGVFYQSGGTAPNRYFAVEWFEIRGTYLPEDNIYTFEVVLYENGDILFQYATMTYGGGWVCGHAGIEDSEGLDGLVYGSFCQQYASNVAVRFYRPAPSARVQVRPAFQGRFAQPGEEVAFRQRICNSGDLGSDTYDLLVASAWVVGLYRADGSTPLNDTDGDGVVDTGLLAQAGSITITVKIIVPAGAWIGDDNSAAVTIRSSRNATRQKTATFQTAIPANFAQVLRDDANAAMSLYVAQPSGVVLSKSSPDWQWGSDVAVAETSSSFIYAWTKSRQLPSGLYVQEIEYTLLGNCGETVRAISKLQDHSGATFETYDYEPAVAVAPNGRIGLLWLRRQWRDTAGYWEANDNIYFAVLVANGDLIAGPINVTNNPFWGTT